MFNSVFTFDIILHLPYEFNAAKNNAVNVIHAYKHRSYNIARYNVKISKGSSVHIHMYYCQILLIRYNISTEALVCVSVSLAAISTVKYTTSSVAASITSLIPKFISKNILHVEPLLTSTSKE